MGANASHVKELDKELLEDRFVGLINYGNTCYINSVLQALFFCRPLRERVLLYKAQHKVSRRETLLSCLADLFYNMASQRKKTNPMAPKKFISRLRKEYESFDNYTQQDAHELLLNLLNNMDTCIQAESQSSAEGSRRSSLSKEFLDKTPGGTLKDSFSLPSETTWVHDIFQGVLTSETKCLNCESVSCRDEMFLDLSVEVGQDTSVTHCLRTYSSSETLCGDQKYFCETCCAKQEAQRRLRLKKLPLILCLHLKRFKFQEQHKRTLKLSCRVVFPLELRLFNTSDDCINPDQMYDLVAVVVHCGPAFNKGHYIALVKTTDSHWMVIDDEIVDRIDVSSIDDFYGRDFRKCPDSGYIMFYQARDLSSSGG